MDLYLNGVQRYVGICYSNVKVNKESQQKRDTQQRKQGDNGLQPFPAIYEKMFNCEMIMAI